MADEAGSGSGEIPGVPGNFPLFIYQIYPELSDMLVLYHINHTVLILLHSEQPELHRAFCAVLSAIELNGPGGVTFDDREHYLAPNM